MQCVHLKLLGRVHEDFEMELSKKTCVSTVIPSRFVMNLRVSNSVTKKKYNNTIYARNRIKVRKNVGFKYVKKKNHAIVKIK